MLTPTSPARPEDVARHYDELDEFYRDVWGMHVHHGLWRTGRETPEAAVEALTAYVAECAALAPGDRVCDVGCGYGETARQLARRYGVHVTGLTLSRAQYARAPETPQTTFLLRDWLDNGLSDASFDAVIAIESTAHMDDKARCIEEMYRVLRPGGRLVVCAWLAVSKPRPWEQRRLLEPICREGRLAGLGTENEYRTWIAQSGLVLDAFEDLSRQVRRTWAVVVGRVLLGLATRPDYRYYVVDAAHRERTFTLTPLRLLLASYTGAFRYGCFAAHRP